MVAGESQECCVRNCWGVGQMLGRSCYALRILPRFEKIDENQPCSQNMHLFGRQFRGSGLIGDKKFQWVNLYDCTM